MTEDQTMLFGSTRAKRDKWENKRDSKFDETTALNTLLSAAQTPSPVTISKKTAVQVTMDAADDRNVLEGDRMCGKFYCGTMLNAGHSCLLDPHYHSGDEASSIGDVGSIDITDFFTDNGLHSACHDIARDVSGATNSSELLSELLPVRTGSKAASNERATSNHKESDHGLYESSTGGEETHNCSLPVSTTNLDELLYPTHHDEAMSKAFAAAAETSQSHLPVLVTPPSPPLPTPKSRQSLRRLFRPRSTSSSKSSIRSVETTASTNSSIIDQSTLNVNLGLPRVRRRSHVYSQRRSLSHAGAVAENAPIDIDHLAACDSDDSASCRSIPFDISALAFDDTKPFLDVSSRNLSHFPRLSDRFGGLVELHMVNNWITAIPGACLGMLVNLQVLDMSQNLLKELPPEIGLLTSLKEIYVRENRLEVVPTEFEQCIKLEVCDFSRNRIATLSPTIFSRMCSLATIDISHNNLRILPSSIGVLKGSLTSLQVDSNPFDPSFMKLVTPLIAAIQLERETSLSVPPPRQGSTEDPERNDSAWSQGSTTWNDDESTGPGTPGSIRSGKRIRSLPPGGLTPDQFAKLEGLFAVKSPPKETPSGSWRSTPSHRSSYPSYRPSVCDVSAIFGETGMSGRATPNGNFRTPSGSVRSRLGMVGAFGVLATSPLSVNGGDGTSKDEFSKDDATAVMDGEKLDVGLDPGETGTIGKSKLFGRIGKRKPRISSSEPGQVNRKSSVSESSPTSRKTSASLPQLMIGPRTSSLEPCESPTATIPSTLTSSASITEKKVASNRHRISSFFSKSSTQPKAISDSAGCYFAATPESPSRIYLHRLLNYLRDAHDLDPRANGASVEVLTQPRESTAPDPGGDQVHDAKQAERLRKKQTPERRRKVVMEILTTERTYVEQLEALLDVYIRPIEERGILNAQENNALFANVKSILLFHQEHLLPDLEKKCSSPEQQLGPVFLAGAPFLRMYSAYYNNFDAANTFVCHLEAQVASNSPANPFPLPASSAASTNMQIVAQRAASKARAKQFREFMQEAKKDPRHTQNSLQSFLILPVQRLPRYKLLVDELLECTPTEHPDYAELKRAREEIRRRVEECNEKKREWEARERGLGVLLRVRVRPWSSGADAVKHVPPGRRFVREGVLRVLKCVEFVGAATGSMRVDALQACGGKKDRFKQNVVGHLIETRFGVKGGGPDTTTSAKDEDGLTALRLTRTAGKEFRFFLFTDVLCWCRAKAGSDGEHDLVRGINIVPGDEDSIEMIELTAGHSVSSSKDKVKHEAVLRVRDRECIVYIRGSNEGIRGWMESIKEGSHITG
ncbi:uncharacterized protein SPPG_05819 [Spizellomyces punctatus DAOM BR117]|uniref:DH domain-containing protein n=1 Tax=Spizellomyces punctatus (strain DAOM BR117) TaxID=645134 RepID=A0A0L0HCW8_SPIPD|nr:uncharacterized protein SPPG_05819 [Spizellomyces punctatus DAOM BR117]KNC98846.1 hypothetical protein SPPG_05819 [Spizellomyces punctatus DAOM BR117]|eukprot:XP_016606886.1 hypothetical protein SPPG_05819 [Spizellomyces punctatus DAOM BR117]